MEINSSVLYVVAAPILGVATYWLRAKTDIWRLSKTADVTAVQTPFNVLQQVLSNRDRENVEMRTELKALVMTHLANDAIERTALVKSLTVLEQSQRELTAMIREDRLSAAKQQESIREQLADIRVDIAGQHTHRREGDRAT